jgi:hypothetical protein
MQWFVPKRSAGNTRGAIARAFPSRNQNDECQRVAQRFNARDVHNADAVVAALEDLSEVFNRVWVDCAWGRELGFVLELGPRSTFQNLVFDNKFLTIFQFTIIFRCITAINSCVDAPAEKQCSSTREMQSDSIFPRLRRCLPGHFSS